MKRRFIQVIVVLLVMLGLSLGIWRVRLAHDVENQLAVIRAAGLPTSGAELNQWYAAVPDSENAALVMTQAFALMRDFPDGRSNEVAKFKMPPRGQSLTTEQKQLLTGYVEMNADALTKAQVAIKFPQSRYPVDFRLGPSTLLLYLAKLKGLAQIARDKSLLAAEAGQLEEAVVSTKNILGMAGTLDEDPGMIAQLVRVALVHIATATLERCLNAGALPENSLLEISKVFSVVEKTNLMARALIGERAIGIPLLRMNRAETERLIKDAEASGEALAKPPLVGRRAGFLKLTGFFERDLRYFLQVMETNIALAKLPPPRCLQSKSEFEKVEAESRTHFYIFSGLLLPALSHVVVKETRSTACLRLAVTAVAVERFRATHGRLPERLSELTSQFLDTVPADPFDGAPLRYRRLGKGYVIYSIGSDGHDDGGREKPTDWKSSDKTTYDITFTVER